MENRARAEFSAQATGAKEIPEHIVTENPAFRLWSTFRSGWNTRTPGTLLNIYIRLTNLLGFHTFTYQNER